MLQSDQKKGWSKSGLFWKTQGDGSRDIVFLHGGPGASHKSLTDLAPFFKGDYRLIFFDQEACGVSRGNPFGWSLSSLAQDTLELLEELDSKNPIIFGHSFGGFLAQEILIQKPSFSDRLILSSTSARVQKEAPSISFQRLGGRKAARAYQNFFEKADSQTWESYQRDALPFYNTRKEKSLQTRSDILFYFWNGERKTIDYRKDLRNIRSETLILCGKEDPITPPALSREINSYLKRGRLRIVKNAGHGVWRDDPLAFQKEIESFLG